MLSRDGQPLLSWTDEDRNRVWWRAEIAFRYLDFLISDCEPNSFAETTFTAISKDATLPQDPSVTWHDGTADNPLTPEQRRCAY